MAKKILTYSFVLMKVIFVYIATLFFKWNKVMKIRILIYQLIKVNIGVS